MTIAVVFGKPSATHPSPRLRAPRVSYAVRVLKARPRSVVRLSPETVETFKAISHPANAHLFTVDSALQAFAHVEI
jgi:hypothetical protein